MQKVDYLDDKTWENVVGLSFISNSFKYFPISLQENASEWQKVIDTTDPYV